MADEKNEYTQEYTPSIEEDLEELFVEIAEVRKSQYALAEKMDAIIALMKEAGSIGKNSKEDLHDLAVINQAQKVIIDRIIAVVPTQFHPEIIEEMTHLDVYEPMEAALKRIKTRRDLRSKITQRADGKEDANDR